MKIDIEKNISSKEIIKCIIKKDIIIEEVEITCGNNFKKLVF